MSDEHKTVFISYRRDVASFIARAIFQDLRKRHYDVFMDVASIDSGNFEQIILNQVEARAHFLVILTPGTIERCAEPEDIMRREIEYAMDKQRNIVPLFVNEFSFKETESYLTGKLAELHHFNGLTVPHDYFDEAMERLRKRYLKQPTTGAVKPAPALEQPIVEKKIEEAAAQPVPTVEQLSAEEYFSRARQKLIADDLEDAIADCNSAIRLNPRYADAYGNRGVARALKGDIVGAINDYDEVLRIEPQSAIAYYNRGLAYAAKDNYEHAFADFTEAIRLNSQYVDAYQGRGELYFVDHRFEEALEDFSQANVLQSANNMTLGDMSVTYYALDQKKEAKRIWRALLAQDQRYRDVDWVGKELHWAKPLVEAARKLIAEL